MGTHHIRHLWSLVVVALVPGVLVTPAEAYDNPELLPDHPTPVIDLAKVFSDTQRAQLEHPWRMWRNAQAGRCGC